MFPIPFPRIAGCHPGHSGDPNRRRHQTQFHRPIIRRLRCRNLQCGKVPAANIESYGLRSTTLPPNMLLIDNHLNRIKR